MQLAKRKTALLSLALAAIASTASASRTDVDGEPLRATHVEHVKSEAPRFALALERSVSIDLALPELASESLEERLRIAPWDSKPHVRVFDLELEKQPQAPQHFELEIASGAWETGLYYAKARFYDPEVGRFLNEDPAGYLDSPNLYQYALFNPLRYRDPSGMAVGDWWDVRSYADFNPFNEESRERTRDFLGGEVKGAVGAAKATVNAAAHPIQTIERVAETVAEVTVNADRVLPALPGELANAAEEWVNADAGTQGEFVGEVLYGVVSGAAGAKAGAAALKVGGKVARSAGRAAAGAVDNALDLGRGLDDAFERGFREGLEDLAVRTPAAASRASKLESAVLGESASTAGAEVAEVTATRSVKASAAADDIWDQLVLNAGDPGNAASAAIRRSLEAAKTTVLGENMGERAIPFARGTGARTLPFGASRAEWDAMTYAQKWKLNDGALRKRIREGDSFRYIGQDPFRDPALRTRFDLTRSELLRLQDRSVPYETVAPSEVQRVLGHP